MLNAKQIVSKTCSYVVDLYHFLWTKRLKKKISVDTDRQQLTITSNFEYMSTTRPTGERQVISTQSVGRVIAGEIQFYSVQIPLSSTTGSADTRCSTKIPSAVYSGVSARTTAMFLKVPMLSSSMVCFKNEGFGISDIWKHNKRVRERRCNGTLASGGWGAEGLTNSFRNLRILLCVRM